MRDRYASIAASSLQLTRGSQTPLDFKLNITAFPPVGRDLLNKPFSVIRGTKVVGIRITPVGEQSIVVGLVRP
jgi:hypothetical protein